MLLKLLNRFILLMLQQTQVIVRSLTLYMLVSSFENSLDLDQARQNVGPDLDPNSFGTLVVPLKKCVENVD